MNVAPSRTWICNRKPSCFNSLQTRRFALRSFKPSFTNRLKHFATVAVRVFHILDPATGTLKHFAQHNFARVNSTAHCIWRLGAMLAVRGRGYFNDSDVAEVAKLALRFVR